MCVFWLLSTVQWSLPSRIRLSLQQFSIVAAGFSGQGGGVFCVLSSAARIDDGVWYVCRSCFFQLLVLARLGCRAKKLAVCRRVFRQNVAEPLRGLNGACLCG